MDPIVGPSNKREFKMIATFSPARETIVSLVAALFTALVFVSSATSALPIA
jgi:hypothetical protein